MRSAADNPTEQKKASWLGSLYIQVLLGIVLGGLLGYLKPAWGVELKPLGDAFVSAVKMLIGPIIFTTVVVGLAGMGDLKKIGRVGGKALIYFEIVTTLALIIGLVVANVFRPGDGFNADPATLDAKGVAKYTNAAGNMGTVEFLLHIIPKTFVSAFAEGEILQVLFLAILFGLALGRLGEHGRPVLNLLHEVARVFFGIVSLVTRAAPIAAGGAMAFTIGEYGVGKLAELGFLLACVYLTCAIFIVVVLGGIARLAGFSLWRIVKYVREELLLVLGTSSSESALPGLMGKNGAHRLRPTGRRDRGAFGLLLQPGRHVHLPDDGGALRRAGDQHRDEPRRSVGVAGGAVAHFERGGWHHGQRLHRAGSHTRSDGQGAGGGNGADPGGRPLHVGSPGDHELHRQHGGDLGGRKVGQRVRRVAGRGDSFRSEIVTA